MDSLLESLQRGLGDQFRLERELGGAGMSRVFLARDATLDRNVVVKVLSPEAFDGTSADRFRREAQLIAKLQHPHVVPILAANEVDGLLYYVMPFIPGDSLRVKMSRGGRLPVRDVIGVMRDVLGALAFAHANGIVHRDIKPENVLLEAGHCLVADFGIAKALSASTSLTSSGISVGTPMYMAPEQVAGDPGLDHRADLYALGVVAYEMLSGAPPFAGTPAQIVTAHLTATPEPIAQRRPEVPEILAELITRALEKDPNRRPRSAVEMLATLEEASQGVATKPGQRSMLRRVRIPLVASVAIAALAAAAWQLRRPAVIERAQSIAVVPPSVADGDTSLVRLSQNLVTLLSNNLDGLGEIRVADPISVLSHARSAGYLVASSDAMRIARSVRAQSVMYGTMIREGSSVRVDVGLYDLRAPATPMAKVSVSASPDSIELLTDSLTIGLLRQVWLKGRPPTPRLTSITTNSPDALRDFLDGERLFMRGEIGAAGDAYRRAVKADTTFWFAAYRYGLARAWMSEPAEDTSIVNRLDRHRGDLQERERALLATSDSSPTESEYVRRLTTVAARFPEYAPAWERLADRLIHHAGRVGRPVADAIDPWRQAANLVPSDLSTANHLVYACIAAHDLVCARDAMAHFDSLIRAEPGASKTEIMDQRLLTLALRPMSRTALDSILAAGIRDSAILGIGPAPVVALAPALIENPGFLAAMETVSRRVEALPIAAGMLRRIFLSGELLARVTRGDWTSLDSVEMVLAAGALPSSVPYANSDVSRARVLAELQGAITPSIKTSSTIARLMQEPNVSAAERVELQWESAINALLRGDSATLRTAQATFDKDTLSEARIASRSLRALETGLGGKRAAAAESLLALEREHGERSPKVWAAFAGDRLLASQWLTESGRLAPADSLLEFTRGYVIGSELRALWPIFAATQLQRSRIAEARGRREDAVRYATVFTRVYDLAPAAHRAQVEEARRRIDRLGDARTSKSSPRSP